MSSEHEIKETCLKTLRDFYGGFWQDLNIDDIDITVMGNGFVNRSYQVRVTKKVENECNDERFQTNVFVRYYGGCDNVYKFKETLRKFCSESEETLVADRLSLKNLTPKIYGLIPNGRLEELIEGQTMVKDDLDDDEIFNSFVRQLVKFHLSQEIPISRNKNFLDFMLKNHITHKQLTRDITMFNEAQQNIIKTFFELDTEMEVNWFLQCFQKVQSPNVFCHHDCKLDNVLVREKPVNGERVVFVDTEFSSFNSRAMDIGVFCSLLNINFTSKDGLIALEIDEKNTSAFEKKFVKQYLKYLKEAKGELDEELDTYEHLLLELRVYSLFARLNWIITLKKSVDEESFKPETLSLNLIDYYRKTKEWLIEKYNL